LTKAKFWCFSIVETYTIYFIGLDGAAFEVTEAARVEVVGE